MGHNFSVKAPAFPQLSNTLGGASAITEVSYSLKLLVFFDSVQHFSVHLLLMRLGPGFDII